jgi:hypothetical protein
VKKFIDKRTNEQIKNFFGNNEVAWKKEELKIQKLKRKQKKLARVKAKQRTILVLGKDNSRNKLGGGWMQQGYMKRKSDL